MRSVFFFFFLVASSRVDDWSENTLHNMHSTRWTEHTHTMGISIWIEINSGNVFNCWRTDCISFHFVSTLCNSPAHSAHQSNDFSCSQPSGIDVCARVVVMDICLCNITVHSVGISTPHIPPIHSRHSQVNLRIYCRILAFIKCNKTCTNISVHAQHFWLKINSKIFLFNTLSWIMRIIFAAEIGQTVATFYAPHTNTDSQLARALCSSSFVPCSHSVSIHEKSNNVSFPSFECVPCTLRAECASDENRTHFSCAASCTMFGVCTFHFERMHACSA